MRPHDDNKPNSYLLFMELNTPRARNQLETSKRLGKTTSDILELPTDSYKLAGPPFRQLFTLAVWISIWETPASDVVFMV